MRRQLVELLEASLSDAHLSRAEKAELKSALETEAASAEDLAYLRNQAFKLARGKLEADPVTTQQGAILEWLERSIRLLVPTPAELPIAEAYFSPGDACRKRICHAFESCQTTADVCVFTITDDLISNAILAAHQRGIRVRIITDDDKSEDRGSDIERLHKAGLPVRTDGTEYHMHHKFAVFDQRILMTGSYNWTLGAAKRNEENIAVMSDPRLVRPYSNLFNALWSQFEGI